MEHPAQVNGIIILSGTVHYHVDLRVPVNRHLIFRSTLILIQTGSLQSNP